MGLDQLFKIIIKEKEANDDDSVDGFYKEFYFRKNYYLQSKMDEVCYKQNLSSDNCVYFGVISEEFFKLYDEVLADLEKANCNLIKSEDFGDAFDPDNEWLRFSIRKVVYLFEQIFKLYDKYPEKSYDYELLYWQWY